VEEPKPRCGRGSWEFIITSFVVDARIYRGNPARVTTFCNRLGLSIKNVLDMDS
jgi:hypothetical protein